jgi:hypothetical protein
VATWKKYDGSNWVTVATPTDLTGYIENDSAAGINSGTTTIDGGKITTGSIKTQNLSSISADLGEVTAGVIYGGSGTIGGQYGMMIDLNNGRILIQ